MGQSGTRGFDVTFCHVTIPAQGAQYVNGLINRMIRHGCKFFINAAVNR